MAHRTFTTALTLTCSAVVLGSLARAAAYRAYAREVSKQALDSVAASEQLVDAVVELAAQSLDQARADELRLIILGARESAGGPRAERHRNPGTNRGSR